MLVEAKNMKDFGRCAAPWIGIGLSLLISACGGGASNGSTPTPTSYALTVSSTNPTAGVVIGVAPADNNGAANGTTSFTRVYNSGSTVTLKAPDTSGGNTFSSWSGCTSSSAAICSMTMNANTTVTANYSAPVVTITPTVTVAASLPSINTTQALTVTADVNGGSGNPTATGTVTLLSGSYTSAATALSNGSASIIVTAGSLAVGSDTLTINYAPDANSSSIYTSASGTATVSVTASSTTYVLTVNSAAPSNGISITVSPADINGAGIGVTSFTRTYNAGTAVALSAPLSSGSYSFASWSGCTSNPSASICNVTMNANTTVTATYNQSSITSITVSPNTATIGTQVQFTATVTGAGNFSKSVSWAVAAPSGSTRSPGDITSAGLYTTPYPAPTTVPVPATSTTDTTKSGSAIVTLVQPSTAAGPALTVDAGNQTHAISPLIYGLNGYYLDSTSATTAHPGIIRWGGDDISRYNYKTNTTNSASDYYFENFTGAANMLGGGNFTGLITTDSSIGAETLGTVPVLGWVANNLAGACSFALTSFPGQTSSNGNCGSGIYPYGTAGCSEASGCYIYGNSTIAAITSISEPPPDITASSTPVPNSVTMAWANGTWAGSWVSSILSVFGSANPAAGTGKGVAIWDLDNEPTWWSAVHRDVHPNPFTYDEVTNSGIGTALAIKTADPTALVGGPVIDYWWAYFYSMKDIDNGWGTGPCYAPWSNPTDREAHGGTPMIEYYLQQFNAYSQSYGIRLLDYVDIHAYFAATYKGRGVGLTTAGDTAEQQVRMNSTRAFWDPTYTDPNYPQPNYITDPNYTTSCSPPAQSPKLIPMLQTWVKNDYPGTKTAIDEYNFGGLESINGAVTQADILGIFGREGLDLAALWPTGAFNTQLPGNMAFAIYRNYDGNNSMFGDMALASTSTNAFSGDGEGQLAVYGALRSSDNSITVIVINKTYGDLTSTLSLANFTSSSTTAKAYLYSNANLNAIITQPDVTVTPPASGSTTGTITTKFPAQSITLIVVPN